VELAKTILIVYDTPEQKAKSLATIPKGTQPPLVIVYGARSAARPAHNRPSP
jgi:hypothetical protein